jgi:hypothetical protein
MQLYYGYEEGFEARAEAVLTKAYKKLLVEFHYEARVHAKHDADPGPVHIGR